MLWVLWVVR